MDIGIELIFKIAAIGIIVTVVSQILRKSDREDFALFVGIIGIVAVLGLTANVLADFFNNVKSIFGF